MSKVAVVYWSGTGNTKAMADAVVSGASGAGADTAEFGADEFSSADVSSYDAIAFGCPAMGAEVLEESVFQPMWDDVRNALKGKKIALFGSWGWVEAPGWTAGRQMPLPREQMSSAQQPQITLRTMQHLKSARHLESS